MGRQAEECLHRNNPGVHGVLSLSIWYSFRISFIYVGGESPGRTGIWGIIRNHNNIWLLLVGFLQVYRNEFACPGYQQ